MTQQKLPPNPPPQPKPTNYRAVLCDNCQQEMEDKRLDDGDPMPPYFGLMCFGAAAIIISMILWKGLKERREFNDWHERHSVQQHDTDIRTPRLDLPE